MVQAGSGVPVRTSLCGCHQRWPGGVAVCHYALRNLDSGAHGAFGGKGMSGVSTFSRPAVTAATARAIRAALMLSFMVFSVNRGKCIVQAGGEVTVRTSLCALTLTGGRYCQHTEPGSCRGVIGLPSGWAGADESIMPAGGNRNRWQSCDRERAQAGQAVWASLALNPFDPLVYRGKLQWREWLTLNHGRHGVAVSGALPGLISGARMWTAREAARYLSPDLRASPWTPR